MQTPQLNEEDLANFIAITGCKEHEKALHYMQMADNKLEAAIQLYMDLEGGPGLSHQTSTQSQQSPQKQPQQFFNSQEVRDVNTMIFNSTNPPPELIRQRSAPDQQLVEKYKKYKEDKRAHDDGIVKKVFNFSYNAITSLFKRPPNHGLEFQKYMQQHLVQQEINFSMGNFQDNLRRANEDMRPLLVYLHNHQNLPILERMIQSKQFVTIINKNYMNVGFLQNEQVQGMLPIPVEAPTLLVYRIDLTEQVVLMDQIKLTMETNFEDLAQKFKQMKGAYNKIYIQEEQVKKEVNAPPQYVPNYFHQQYQQVNQQHQQKQQQQRERDNLREQQEQAYRLAEQQAMEKRQKEEEKKQLEQTRLLEEQQKEEQRIFQKAAILSSLPNEPEEDQGIAILFRFVHGTRTRRFNLTDKIKVIFEFVACQEDEYFNDPHANIDLIQNFPRISLKSKQEETIGDVFVDSANEQLIVEEME